MNDLIKYLRCYLLHGILVFQNYKLQIFLCTYNHCEVSDFKNLPK